MDDNGPNGASIHWRWIRPLLLSAPVVLVVLGLWLSWRRQREGDFVSCRNHATFVAWALDRYIQEHRQLPHVPGLPGEELVCRLDFQGAAANCHAGAPGQGVGGWQMVNASPQAWDAVLEAMRSETIPVIWCGRPHRPGGEWDGEVRVVLAIGQWMPAPDSISALIEQNTTVDDEGRRSFEYFRHSVVYGMPEEELQEALATINTILRRNGEPATPLDVEGRRDYWEIARPFQDTAPPE
jgi:hypothetical protein